jgi:hypothetical protein
VEWIGHLVYLRIIFEINSLVGKYTYYLISLSVYYMSVLMLLRTTINRLTSLLRKFMWGKLEKDRYLALISWDKVSQEKEERGWGYRIFE